VELVRDSINLAARRAPRVVLSWHRRYDPQREFVGGQRLKNDMLDDIDDGWVCILDDDTLMLPKFLLRVAMIVGSAPLAGRELRAVVVSQRRTNRMILEASAENAVIGMIDAGQAVLRRDLIGDYRIPEEYAGDGMWLETLLRDRPDVHYLKEVLSAHNAITGVDVGPVTA
jgi:hypothetical protein